MVDRRSAQARICPFRGRVLPSVGLAVLIAGLGSGSASGTSEPVAQSSSVSAFTAFPVNIALRATDDGQPNPPGALSHVIMSLPGHGSLSEPGTGTTISSVPYTLTGKGMWVTYTGAGGYVGDDSFTFVANDGGSAPDGGDSNVGTISIMVGPTKVVDAVGWNGTGELGQGTRLRTVAQPAMIGNVAAIAAGGFNSLVLRTDGTVWGWGDNDLGELGDGTTEIRSVPVRVSNLTSVAAVAGGLGHSLAVKGDGTVWAWGANGVGELGDGTTTTRLVPVQVSGMTDAVAVAAGYAHSVAAKSDGTVWAWGYNDQGQLGDGTTTQRNRPVKVLGLANVLGIAACEDHSLAVKSDGTVWGWGQNDHGQLGDGTTTRRLRPIQASGLTGMVAVATGHYYSMALRSDGTVWGWGMGSLGGGTPGQNK